MVCSSSVIVFIDDHKGTSFACNASNIRLASSSDHPVGWGPNSSSTLLILFCRLRVRGVRLQSDSHENPAEAGFHVRVAGPSCLQIIMSRAATRSRSERG